MSRRICATLLQMAKRGTANLAALLVVALQTAAWAGGPARPLPPAPQARGLGCGQPLSLHLCPATPRPAAGEHEPLIRTRRPDQRSFNRLQRLAGALADRMDAGTVGPVKLKFKVILE